MARHIFMEWKELELRFNTEKTVHKDLPRAMEQECRRGRHVIKVLLTCIRFFATNDLVFRGGEKNEGNFFSLISEFDPILAAHLHLASTERGQGKVSYLSPGIQNEFIALLADKVKPTLIDEITDGKYYAVMHGEFDS